MHTQVRGIEFARRLVRRMKWALLDVLEPPQTRKVRAQSSTNEKKEWTRDCVVLQYDEAK